MSQPAGMPASFILPYTASPNGMAETMTWADSIGTGDAGGGYVNNAYDWVLGPDGAGPDSFGMIFPGSVVPGSFVTSWLFIGWGATGHNTWRSPYFYDDGHFVIANDTSQSIGGQGQWLTFNPAPTVMLVGGSMINALAKGAVGTLNLNQITTPSNLPISVIPIRNYVPVLDQTQLVTGATPVVTVFPGPDSETRDGLKQQGAFGDYEVAVSIIARVVPPTPLAPFIAAIDALMNLRQAIRDVLKTNSGIPALGVRPGLALGQGVDVEVLYDPMQLRNSQIFESVQVFRFRVIPA